MFQSALSIKTTKAQFIYPYYSENTVRIFKTLMILGVKICSKEHNVISKYYRIYNFRIDILILPQDILKNTTEFSILRNIFSKSNRHFQNTDHILRIAMVDELGLKSVPKIKPALFSSLMSLSMNAFSLDPHVPHLDKNKAFVSEKIWAVD